MKQQIRRAVVLGLVLGMVVAYGQQAGANSPKDRLFARIYGAVAGAAIGNAIGEPPEGYTWQKIEQKYGFLDRFVASEKNLGPDVHTPQRFGPDWIHRSYVR